MGGIDTLPHRHLREAQITFAGVEQVGGEKCVECAACQLDANGPQAERLPLQIVA